jgi:spore maturation protein SpmA
MNWVFLVLVAGAVVMGAFTGRMKAVSDGSLEAAKGAVELAFVLVGQMGVWLGFMRVVQDAGFMQSIARVLAPVMRRLFPDVPAEHPAMGAMIMNLSANVLGLGNAATPFGLKAMVELDKLNKRKGVATDAMALFLAINTSGVAVLPLGAIAIRAGLGSKDAGGIFLPSLLATSCSTLVAIIATKLLQRLKIFQVENYPEQAVDAAKVAAEPAAAPVVTERPKGPLWAVVLASALVLSVATAAGLAAWDLAHKTDAGAFTAVKTIFGDWLLPGLMLVIVALGLARGVKVYESFIAGAKEAFQIAITIIPFLVAILVAVRMFRDSGAMGGLVTAVSPVASLLGFPAESLPMVFIRPLSGSGALAVMTEVMKTNGPDSLVGYTVSVMNGSTETTFYVLAVYFGAVQVRAARHTVAACLCSEAAGMTAAAWLCRAFFG